MKNTIWRFSTARRVIFGRGSLHCLWDELDAHGLCRPLVVTDQPVADSPLISELLHNLDRKLPGAMVFRAGEPEPTIATAQAAVKSARDQRIDCIIGIGGGSNLDLAKVTATVLAHGGAPQDYFGFDRIPGPVLPLIAIPTTAGTGSEVSHSAVLTDPDAKMKVSMLSRWLRPSVAIIDPATTESCPESVAAHSGIDALVHAVEAYTNRHYADLVDVDVEARAYEGSYRLTQLMAAEAIRLIGRSMVDAVKGPSNQLAKDDMAHAALLAGMAFSNSGVGIVHALEYPVGAITHCSHGEGNGLLLPHVMRYLLPERTQELADIARWLGVNVAGLSLRQAAESAIRRVEDLQDALGIRKRLRDLGLRRETIPDIARKAHGIRRLMELSVRPPSVEDLQAILEEAY